MLTDPGGPPPYPLWAIVAIENFCEKLDVLLTNTRANEVALVSRTAEGAEMRAVPFEELQPSWKEWIRKGGFSLRPFPHRLVVTVDGDTFETVVQLTPSTGTVIA